MTCLRTFGAIVWVSLSLAVAGFAQRPSAAIFSVDDGLPSSTIYGLAQDPTGRLWVLTRNAVSVYDGTDFKTFTSADGLPPVILAAIAVDGDGKVWVASWLGARLFALDGDTWKLQASFPAGPGSSSSVITMASTVWRDRPAIAVGTTGGLILWDGEDWQRWQTEDGLPGIEVTDLAATAEGLVVGTDRGLCRLTERGIESRLLDLDPRLGQSILAVHPEAEERGGLWVLGRTWLGRLDGDRFTAVVEFPALHPFEDRLFGSIAFDEAGGLYFGSPFVLYWMEAGGGRLRTLSSSEGLATNGVTALLQDRHSNVWVGSLRGLSRISSWRFLSYDRSQGLLEDEVSAIAELAPGRYLLGHGSGLTFLDQDAAEVIAFDRPASEPGASRVLDIAVDGDQVWLAAHDLGLVRLAPDRTWQIELSDDRFFSVEVDANGRLWAASMRRLFTREDRRWIEVDTGFELGEVGFYRWLHSGADGRLYVATRYGLLWREQDDPALDRWSLARADGDQAGNVYNVLAEGDGTVWAATGAGLRRLEGGHLVKVEEAALAVDRPIYFLLRDPRGWLWLGTDDGILVWDGGRLRQLSVRHGLAGREVNRGAGLVDHRGRVWIGTERGASVYRELYDRWPRRPPRLELRAIEVAGQPQPIAGDEPGRLELGHRQNDIVFHLGTVSLAHEEEVHWRYRLEGFEDDWHGPAPFTSPRLRYTNLPPGSYRLRAAAGWPGGPWSDDVISPALEIARPLWRTPWFYAVVVLATVGAAVGVHGLRVRSIRSRNRELEALNARLEEEAGRRRRGDAERERLIADLTVINQELERFTYTVSHDLKAPLVTITGFVGLLKEDLRSGNDERVERDLELIESAATKMGRLLHELLELSRLGHVSYSREPVELAEIFREALDLTATPIRERGVVVTVAPGLPTVFGERTRLLEVAQNLIENAVKFLGDQPSPRIEIGVRPGDGKEPVIFVRDNGVGIAPRYHEKVFGLFERLDLGVEGTGVGLAIVRRIVESHGGKIWVESEGEGQGTTFCFTLPEGR